MSAVMITDINTLPVYEEPTAEELLAQFDAHLDNLEDALKSTEDACRMVDNFKGKGAFTLFVGSVTGTGQKDLASMIKLVAGNLRTTQLALELVMRLQIRKNAVLREFHDALTRKIANIAADTTTLDENQREAAIFILSELRQHVAKQIAYQDMVEAHGRDLQALREDHRQTLAVLAERKSESESEMAQLREALQIADERARNLAAAHDQTNGRLAEAELALAAMTTGWPARVRNWLPVAAAIVSVAALAMEILHK